MKKDINEILSKVNNLPHNFYIAIKVSKMLDDFNVNINTLSKVIGSDQALTIKILKLCNSAQYGFSRKITTIKDAIARIGFKTLKTMIFTIVSKSSFNQKVEGYGLEQGELWRNSLSCATYSRYIAELIGYVDPDQAFTAGLLRDVGKLILHEYVKEDYDNILRMVNEDNVSFGQAEEEVLGFNHCQIGALVADKWKFPQVLIDTIKYHHTPEEGENAGCEDINLVKIVHFADSLTVMLGNGIGNDGMMYDVDLNSLESLSIQLSPENLELLIADMVNLNSDINSLITTID